MSTQQVQAGNTQKSTEAFVTALILNLAIAGAEFGAFLILRRRFKHIYEPRSTLPPQGKRSQPLPGGLLDVIPTIIHADDEEIINRNGLDAYLFVRFLKVMMWIFGPIAVLSWIILLPVYGTSTGQQTGMNAFTFGNVGRDQQARLAAPLIICWLSTFYALFIIRREYNMYIQKRRAFLTSKRWATTAQAKVVLVTGIPDESCNKETLEQIAGRLPGGVRKIWLAKEHKELTKAYEERTKQAQKLEKAENKAIKLSLKRVKKGKVPKEGDANLNHAESGNGGILSRYLPAKKFPTHRLGKIPFIGRKVSTLSYSQDEILNLNSKIEQQRSTADSFKAKSSAFLLFNDQLSAHRFVQTLGEAKPQGIKGNLKAKANVKGLPLKMTSRFINVHRDDVIWDNLDMNPAMKKGRQAISWAITLVTIIFWAIPVAFVTSISNVSSLCERASWLAWLCTLPTPVNGILQGALPPIALAILFALLPVFLRALSKFEGVPLHSLVERSLQRRYFAFLFVHGFIVTTLASGIMAGINTILNDPSQAVSILAQTLPGSATFFLTLLLVNGLTGSAGGILQIARLVIYYVKEILLGGNPRSLWKVRYTMPTIKYGQVFPPQLLLVSIALGYSTIAPFVCGFALIAFTLYWFVWKYLMLWVHDEPSAQETAGLHFQTAINHFMAGMYIQHLCLIGLFWLSRNTGGGLSAVPEAVLMIILLVATIAFHLYLNVVYGRRALYLPDSMQQELSRNEARYAEEMKGENSRLVQAETNVSEQTAVDNAQNGTKGEHTYGAAPKAVNGDSHPDDDELAGGLHENSFLHPALWKGQPTVWIPRDDLGISREHVSHAREKGVDMTDEDTSINEKGKVDISRDTLPGVEPDQ